MFAFTEARLMQIFTEASDRTPNKANMNSVVVAAVKFGNAVDLHQPWVLAHYAAQIMVESACFRYDRELWNGKGAQATYEGRKGLGNTVAGDGKLFMGRTAIQITGRANTAEFYKWCQAKFLCERVPDFVKTPDLMNTDPWEGLGPVWYWDTRKLSALANKNDIETISVRINGGHNGYEERLRFYTRVALTILGYKATEIREFQEDHKVEHLLAVDGIAGRMTRAALHAEMKAL
jgi:putative chitinase